MTFQYQDLIEIFNRCFKEEYQTILVRGTDEPIYLPANPLQPYHQVVFAHGYFASALHEIAHWCVAGEKRRLLEDYGYWYEPDGRTLEQQRLFEQVEAKPQALEWVFNLAANKEFKVSSDNLNGEVGDNQSFKLAVKKQTQRYLNEGLPERAAVFTKAIAEHYRKGLFPNAHETMDKVI